ncbi:MULTISPECIES: hypothetical protein [Streptomyces]|uniref:hypothetical protein n=1 Tax=Streptomyces TaxID=1883 RepID=UPI0014308820|nr:hypothetical protein [Streptomyces sp. 2BBP-J2]NIL54429.1 hypothetical protein [Streptomyces sp. 2BBP-J2]
MRSVGCGTRGVGYVTRIVGFLVAVGGLNLIRTRTMFGILEAQDVVIGVLTSRAASRRCSPAHACPA